MRRITISRTLLILIVFLLSGCTAVTWVDGPSGRSCKAYCKTIASDGESCVEWSDTASNACVGKYTPATYCCTGAGSCPLFSPGAKGLACYCDMSTPYGVRRFPGTGCN